MASWKINQFFGVNGYLMGVGKINGIVGVIGPYWVYIKLLRVIKS